MGDNLFAVTQRNLEYCYRLATLQRMRGQAGSCSRAGAAVRVCIRVWFANCETGVGAAAPVTSWNVSGTAPNSLQIGCSISERGVGRWGCFMISFCRRTHKPEIQPSFTGHGKMRKPRYQVWEGAVSLPFQGLWNRVRSWRLESKSCGLAHYKTKIYSWKLPFGRWYSCIAICNLVADPCIVLGAIALCVCTCIYYGLRVILKGVSSVHCLRYTPS